jgi:hypothetical protein
MFSETCTGAAGGADEELAELDGAPLDDDDPPLVTAWGAPLVTFFEPDEQADTTRARPTTRAAAPHRRRCREGAVTVGTPQR